jgi:poly(A) polymerase
MFVVFHRVQQLEPGLSRRGSVLEVRDASPLAAIRAARWCAQLELNLRVQTIQTLKSIPSAGLLESRAELEALLMTNQAAHGMDVLDRIGWIGQHLPELEACKTVEPFGFHHLNVFQHSLEALRVLTDLFSDANLETRWATLLHDVGKPAAKVWDEVRGRWSFFGHDDRGAEIARDLLTRLGYDSGFIERVTLLVARHMIRLPADAVQASRFVRRQRALLPDLLQVMLADREAARGASSSAEARHAYQIGFDRVLEAMNAHDSVKPLLTGEDVMRWLNLEPGREVGQALEFVRTLQDAGDVQSADEARAALLEWARVKRIEPENRF